MSTPISDPYPWKEPVTKPSRGAFIVIEGLDRAGKTTQVTKLCDRLYSEGHNVKSIRFPDRTTPMGQMIDRYLQSKTEMDDHTIHLLFSANRWEKAKWIEETLLLGYTIVCDRYYYSGMVYSAAKDNPSLSLHWARQPDVGLPRPDRVIFLDLDAEQAAQRGGYGEEKYEKKEMQIRVRELFLDLKWSDEEENQDMEVFNAGGSVEAVGQDIWASVERTIKGVKGGSHALAHVNPWRITAETFNKHKTFLGVRNATNSS